MRVAAYFSPLSRIDKPTGVSQHFLQMASRLAACPRIEASILSTPAEYRAARPYLPGALRYVPLRCLPAPERVSRFVLQHCTLIPAERWAGPVDWVWCAKEQPIATRQAKLLVTVHDVLPFEPDIPGYPRRHTLRDRLRWRCIMSATFRRADLIATVSQFTRNRLLDLFSVPDPDRIVVIPNGVSETFFTSPGNPEQILDRHGVTPQNYLVAVGSLTYRKGGDLLLELASRLNREMPGVRMIVTGRRHDAELLDEFKRRRAADPNFPIDLPGYVSETDMVLLLGSATALLFPSRYEGFGIPIVEAMAAGAPVICSRSGSLPEVAGDSAMYVGLHVSDLLQAVKSVRNSSALRRELATRGRQRAHHFTWDRSAARLLEILESN